MTARTIISLSDPTATLETVGGKGASLARLSTAGLPVPDGFNVTTAAYRRFVADNQLQGEITAALAQIDSERPSTLEAAAQQIQAAFLAAPIPPEIAGEILRAYAALPGQNPAVAVRSSATAEDLPEASFAGQQETYLNVCGPQAVLQATRKCWASLWTARAIDYRARQSIAPEDVALAVVVQLLAPAESAGILFTANPVSGARDQVVISAAWGLGEAVVGGLVNPDLLVIDKESGHVLERQTADKQVMTVRVNGGVQQQPAPDELRQAPVLSDETAAKLAELGLRIERLYETPMDVEWAIADGQIAIVQARPVTALPEPAILPPDEWPMPDPKGQYMRASVVDFLPDPLSPLFATLALPHLSAALRRLVDRLVAKPEALPDDTFYVINGYAYMQVSYTPKQWWLLITRLVPAFPRMLRTQVDYWQDVELPHYRQVTNTWRAKDPAALDATQLLQGADDIMQAAADHLTTLQASTLGAGAGSEMIFTRVYDKLIRRPDDPPATAFLLGLDSQPLRAEKDLFDLAGWVAEHPALQAALLDTPPERLLAEMQQHETAPEGAGSLPDVPPEIWQAWQARFAEHLALYGHAIYDLDFAKPLPVDDPTPLLSALQMYLSGQGKDPYARQQAQNQAREAALESVRARTGGIKRWAFEKTLGWAQRIVPLREDSIAEIGLGYPTLRALLEELGRRLVQTETLQASQDVYWLEYDELESAAQALEHGQTPPDLRPSVRWRRAAWQAQKQVTPPGQLPPKAKYMGINVESMLSGGGGEDTGSELRGFGASPGLVTGTARVLHGPEDFDEMHPGEVLVATITTPAWTPLFAMASAVVTDIGGALSHGSIVAREYGIPAVLGAGVATKRIHSGDVVTVDGSAGVVRVESSLE